MCEAEIVHVGLRLAQLLPRGCHSFGSELGVAVNAFWLTLPVAFDQGPRPVHQAGQIKVA